MHLKPDIAFDSCSGQLCKTWEWRATSKNTIRSNYESLPTCSSLVGNQERAFANGSNSASHASSKSDFVYVPGKGLVPDSDNAPQALKTEGGMIFARDPQGRLHQAPAGTPIPAGWKADKTFSKPDDPLGIRGASETRTYMGHTYKKGTDAWYLQK